MVVVCVCVCVYVYVFIRELITCNVKKNYVELSLKLDGSSQHQQLAWSASVSVHISFERNVLERCMFK